MKNIEITKLLRNRCFRKLVYERTRLSMVLSLVVLVGYYGFILTAAFYPTLLSLPISEKSLVTVGWPIGAALIIISWLLTGWYVYCANRRFDDLNTQFLREVH